MKALIILSTIMTLAACSPAGQWVGVAQNMGTGQILGVKGNSKVEVQEQTIRKCEERTDTGGTGCLLLSWPEGNGDDPYQYLQSGTYIVVIKATGGNGTGRTYRGQIGTGRTLDEAINNAITQGGAYAPEADGLNHPELCTEKWKIVIQDYIP